MDKPTSRDDESNLPMMLRFVTSPDDRVYHLPMAILKPSTLDYHTNKGHDDTKRKFSMYFYLPDKNDGLDSLLKEMVSTPGFVDSHIPRYRVEVADFRIPKFNISFMFSTLDFPELDSLSLYHKACVKIDEDGAEAAAVTFGMMETGTGFHMEKRIDFVADHPFLFLIREDKTGTILFLGQIFDPSRKSN
ncbi:unnamed protein product [Arabidopsis arenosa]|uniref:Serpin domain-containing protein n=1 Tax=Arabidopsis arenosa TaxID=38785 RepID=A0A8S1ZQG8_ARAAE|nr:unnamed protein product [Arabidopsis arenosa]